MLRASVVAGRALSRAREARFGVGAAQCSTTTTDTLHECWYENRSRSCSLLVAAGRYREAAHRLERRWPGTTSCSNGFDDVLWTMERARVLERLGRRDEAVASYAFVADAWRTADPELQPLRARSARGREAVTRRRARTTTLALSNIGRSLTDKPARSRPVSRVRTMAGFARASAS